MSRKQKVAFYLGIGFLVMSIAGYMGSWLSVAYPGTPLLYPMVLAGQGAFFLILGLAVYLEDENDD